MTFIGITQLLGWTLLIISFILSILSESESKVGALSNYISGVALGFFVSGIIYLSI